MTEGSGKVFWLTGLSGAGKTTLAQGLQADLRDLGIASVILDGDALRSGLNADLGFSEEDRTENVRRTVELARLISAQGVHVICSLISPLQRHRDHARKQLAPHFQEIYVRCSVETAARRDPKGLYRKAMDGSLTSFTGISSPYEVPNEPELIIGTEDRSLSASRAELLAYATSVLGL